MPIPPLNPVADHPGAASDVSLGYRAVARGLDRRAHVVGPDVHAVDVVEQPVVRLADDG